MPWSEKEQQEMADRHFKGLRVQCPICQGPVQIEEEGAMGKATVDLLMTCRRCGESALYAEPHLEAMNLQWTHDQKIAIVERYWANGFARCPIDQARLDVQEIRAMGQAATPIIVWCKRCGRNFDSLELENAAALSPFEQKYEILRDIGEGGMGVVRLIRDRATGEELAAKTILPEHLRDVEIIRRFNRETRILNSISHQNVVQIRDAYLDETGGVIVMEYLPGGDLAARINDPSVTQETLIAFFDGIVAGLDEVHRVGIVHRDLKPWNVLIDAVGNAKITDFGLAVMEERDSTRLTRDGQFIGTRHYAAPEQLAGREAGIESDIYALGLIAYEVYTRESPYAPPIRLPAAANLNEVLARALANNPVRRTVTGREIAEILRQCLGR